MKRLLVLMLGFFVTVISWQTTVAADTKAVPAPPAAGPADTAPTVTETVVGNIKTRVEIKKNAAGGLHWGKTTTTNLETKMESQVITNKHSADEWSMTTTA